MGSLCSTSEAGADAPTASAPAGGRGAPPASTASIPHHVSEGGRSSNTPGRERERRGLRQNLVHERKDSVVWANYDIVKEIGQGMTGKVYQVSHKGTSETYALKCMEMRRIDVELIDDLRNEIELLKMLDHPNVIKLFEYYEDPDNIYLILELCDGGELFDRLHQQKGNRYSEAEAARLMFRMCAAIGYCHFMGVSHRDLKLENFIFESKDEASNVKLIDFGLSSKYGATMRRMHTMVGTPYYIAPEVLNQEETGNRGYTAACDCWSLGVIAYMLLSGTPPFKGRRDREVLQAVRNGKFTLSGPKWEAVSKDAKDFIRHLLVYNPSKRMTSDQALKHSWLQQARHVEEARPLDPEVLTSLRDFAKLSAFKRAALEAIAFSMSAQSISHLREQFSKLDKERTGSVVLRDFVDVLQKSGSTREEAAFIFQVVDQDNKHRISYTEFLAATISRRLWLSRERIMDAFQRLDVEGTGFITRENLKELLGDEWTAEKAQTMMSEVDAKGDDRIDFEEFLAVMTKDLLRVEADAVPGAGGAGGDESALGTSASLPAAPALLLSGGGLAGGGAIAEEEDEAGSTGGPGSARECVSALLPAPAPAAGGGGGSSELRTHSGVLAASALRPKGAAISGAGGGGSGGALPGGVGTLPGGIGTLSGGVGTLPGVAIKRLDSGGGGGGAAGAPLGEEGKVASRDKTPLLSGVKEPT